MKKKSNKKIIYILIFIAMICAYICLPFAFADTEISDYVLKDAEVSVDGENDGEVSIEFASKSGGTFSAFQGIWGVSEEGSTSYFTLDSFVPASTTNSAYIQESEVSTGSVMYAELSTNATGFVVQANEAIWTAKYKVDKDTPEGTYTVKLNLKVVDNANDLYDIDSTGESLTAVVTVSRASSTTPLVATFSGDSGVNSIDVHCKNAQDEQAVENTYVRNADTGEIDVSGNGQVNFTVNLKNNYKIVNVSATDGTYTGTIKGPGDTGAENTYIITKINSNTTITITTEQRTEYVGTFNTDSGVSSVDVYNTTSYTSPSSTNATSAYARDGQSGQVTMDGSGQINFKINPKNGYYIDESDITVTGNYGGISKPSELGYTNIYRITNIAGDITINVVSRAKINITPTVSGYTRSYEYTGERITPVVTVESVDHDATLIEGTDYTVTYGENKNVTSGGTITITPVTTSKYQFEEQTLNFNISAKEINDDDVTAPSTITYMDGTALTPSVSVSVGGKQLVKNQDYTVEYTGQTANIGEYVTVTVTGEGNYSGTGVQRVLIVDKPTQALSFADTTITKTYGDSSFTKTATHTTGDGTITYSSSNQNVATVNESTGAVNIVGAGDTVITATASATANYAKTTASYTLTVNKRAISIKNASVRNKEYDGTTSAVVESITLNGVTSNTELVKDTDYTVEARFADASVGSNKVVTVELSLVGNSANNFEVSTEVYTARANISAIVISEGNVSLSQGSYTFDGNNKEPGVSVIVAGRTLTAGDDYTVNYRNNINAGTAYADVEGCGNYSGSVSKSFTINKLSVTPVVEDIADVTYTGEEQEPALSVKVNGQALARSAYTATYSNNINAGTANVVVSAVSTGNYTFDNVEKSFRIKPYVLQDSDVALEYTTIRWNGQERRPTVTVRANNKLVSSSDYEVQYSNNTEVGTAIVSVTAKSGTNYTGTVTKNFTIADKDVLTFTGISDNQTIAYTGNPVVIAGNILVSPSSSHVTADMLTVKYYDNSNSEISRPTEIGTYSVVYSYSNDDYVGNLRVNFEITKARSSMPADSTTVIKAIEGQTLADVNLPIAGLSWVDDSVVIQAGNNLYNATYTKNNDTVHYTTETIQLKVYGRVYIDITTSVEGNGGNISNSIEHVLEGSSNTIQFMPEEGYQIDYVKVNGRNVDVDDNELIVTVGANDVTVVVKYKIIQYKITITGTNIDDIESDVVNVDYKSDTDLKISAKYGYKLTSVKVNGTEMIDSLADGILSLTSVTSDINIVATAERIIYKYSYGSNQEGTIGISDGLVFIIDAKFSLFCNKVYVDDKLIDTSNYTAKSGSTVIRLSRDFIETLAQDSKTSTHKLSVVFSDGGEANTNFTLINPNIADGSNVSGDTSKGTTKSNSKSTKTGDNIRFYIAVFAVALFVIVFVKTKVSVKK